MLEVKVNGQPVTVSPEGILADIFAAAPTFLDALREPIGGACEACGSPSDTVRQLAVEVNGEHRHALLYDPDDEDDRDYILRMIERLAPREGEQRAVRLIGVRDLPRA